MSFFSKKKVSALAKKAVKATCASKQPDNSTWSTLADIAPVLATLEVPKCVTGPRHNASIDFGPMVQQQMEMPMQMPMEQGCLAAPCVDLQDLCKPLDLTKAPDVNQTTTVPSQVLLNPDASQPSNVPPPPQEAFPTAGETATRTDASSSSGVAESAEAPPKEQHLEIFCGSCPYDHLRSMKLSEDPDNTICLTHPELYTLWRAEVYSTGDREQIVAWLQAQGLERQTLLLSHVFNDPELPARTAFSIECCSSVTSLSAAHMQVLREFTHALLKLGANVAMADFALDIVNPLFEGVLPPLFSKKPVADVDGNVQLRFSPPTLADCANGQISMLGTLAQDGETSIFTMSSTRRPVLGLKAQGCLRVLAVAVGAGSPRNDELVSIQAATGKWEPGTTEDKEFKVGTPVIMTLDEESEEYLRTEWKGNLLLFGAHFSEIQRIGGLREDVLSEMVEAQDGAEEALRFKARYCAMEGNAPVQMAMMQECAKRCVTKAPQAKKRFSSKALSSKNTA